MPFLFFLLAKKKNRELVSQPPAPELLQANALRGSGTSIAGANHSLSAFAYSHSNPDGMLLHALTSFAKGRQLL